MKESRYIYVVLKSNWGNVGRCKSFGWH